MRREGVRMLPSPPDCTLLTLLIVCYTLPWYPAWRLGSGFEGPADEAAANRHSSDDQGGDGHLAETGRHDGGGVVGAVACTGSVVAAEICFLWPGGGATVKLER